MGRIRFYLVFLVLVAVVSLTKSKTLSIKDASELYEVLGTSTADDFDDDDEEIKTNSILDRRSPAQQQELKRTTKTEVKLPESASASSSTSQQLVCNLSKDLIEEIASYQNVTNLILTTVLNGSFKGRTYN